MIIDTHCHLDFEQFNSDRDEVIRRARAAGVFYMINIGSSLEGSAKSVELASEHDNIFATVGIHPHHAEEIDAGSFSETETLAKKERVVAIGEIGLDYFKSPSSPASQKELFVRFITLSRELGLPLIIHNRNAHRDTCDILNRECQLPVRGVVHCFSGDRKELDEVLSLGLFVSFTCNLTFKNAKGLREVAKFVPKERLLLETDAPFLAPQAYRGKRNEPAYVTQLRDTFAELLNLPKGEIEDITTANARNLFGINI
ncbi:MAG: TatD family hydrolase [Candidatus Omnitrophica bacterium]|nr:TatD family hydrolase [Candidatus Omnitrophota bacterium]